MKKYILIFFTALLSVLGHSQTYNILHGTLNRNYTVHLPTGYNPANKYPLVFNLHGYTSDASQEELYTKMNITADANHFIVVYPNGISNAWNSGFIGTYGTGIDDVGFISAIIDSMNTNFSINLNRVYSCGMSNGGFQSYRLACELSNRIAAIASVTGSMTDSTFHYCNPSRTVPVMEIHGTTDPVVNYLGSIGMKPIEDVIQFWKTKNICTAAIETTTVANTSLTDGSTAEFIKIAGCDLGIENWFYKIINGGHTWPNALIDVSVNGNTNRDFDASQRIWDFFNMYTLSGPTNIGNHATSQESIKVYPNPTSQYLYMELGENIELTNIKLIDIFGRIRLEIPSSNEQKSNVKVDITSLEVGNYYIKMTDKTGNTINKKVCIVN